MRVVIRKTYEDMSAAAADIVLAQLHEKPTSIFCFPSGDSPTGMFRILVEKIRGGKADFTRAKFVGLDEWVGMDRYDRGSCKNYMYETFFDAANIRPDQIVFFDAKANDLQAECKMVDDFIFQHGPIDLVIVGVGLNGHLGLNEPGSRFTNHCHVVELEASTKTTAQKYFKENTTLTKGITLGLHHITHARTTVVIASGERKAGIISKIVQGPITEQVPGSIMQTLDHGIILLDEAAAGNLVLNA